MKDKIKAYLAAVRGMVHATGLTERDMLTPKRDWYLILGGACVLVSGFVGFGLYTYYVGSVAYTDAVSDTAEQSAPDVERLSRVLGGYREMNARFEALRGSYVAQEVLESDAVSEDESALQPAAEQEEDDEATEVVDLRS